MNAKQWLTEMFDLLFVLLDEGFVFLFFLLLRLLTWVGFGVNNTLWNRSQIIYISR